jgi:MFS family permease
MTDVPDNAAFAALPNEPQSQPASFPAPGPHDERRTVRLDLARNGAGGFIDACERTFFLLIAISVLDGNWVAKSVLAGATGFGFLFSPLVVQRVRRSGHNVVVPATRLLVVAALVSLASAVLANQVLFVIGSSIGLALAGCVVPFTTAIFNRNYPEGRRGRYVSAGIWVRVLGMTVMSLAVAEVLERRLQSHPGTWRVVPLAASAAYAFQAVVMRRFPASPLRLRPDEPANEREAWKVRLRLMREDGLLRSVLLAWMFMGFANLMMLPLRVEYTTNPRYGLSLGPRTVTMLTIIIPAVVRLVMTVPFGWAFDKLSFFVLRILVNVVFAISIVSFFIGTDLVGLVVGAVAFGLAVAGGDVLWNLWTIKFAPPGRVADYMALHMFFTGVRGISAPFVGFYLAERVSITGMGWICAALIGVSSLILVPQYFVERETRRAAGAAAVPAA